MRAGELRCYVYIEQRATTQVGAGDQATSYTTFLEGYAAITPLTGRELIAAQAANSAATHRIKMRYASGVTTAMRVRYGSRYFNIVSPPRNVDERSREMVFEAEEGLADG